MNDSTQPDTHIDAAAEIARCEALLAKAKLLAGQTVTGGTATITVNANGIGLTVALIVCAFMAGMNLVLVGMLIDHSRKIDDLNHYLTAIYADQPKKETP